jgi:DNA-binding transcriptional LysR family regulator
MNFRFLEAFHWITRLGSFAAAAEKLHTTQSAVSARIKELEESLGVTLFNRVHGGIALTTAGRALVPLAEEALAISATIKSAIGSKTKLSGMLRIGVGEIVALTWFPTMLTRLSSTYPAIEVELVIDLTVNLNRMLIDGQLDTAFVVDASSPHVIGQSVGRTPIRWMASPAVGLRGDADADQLAKQPIITLSRDSHLHGQILNWFDRRGLRPKLIHGCNSVTAMISLTRTGCGIGVLPVALVEGELNRKELAILDLAPPVDHYEFFVVRDRRVTDPTILLISELALETTTFSDGDPLPTN